MTARQIKVRGSGLILASGSPRRAAMLRELGFVFTVVPSEAPEVAPAFLSPAETARANAWSKAWPIARRYPDCTVLGADTVVSLDGVNFGKPGSRAEAERMLKALQGRTHQVATGVCLIQLREKRWHIFVETTAVTFRRLKLPQIRRYLECIDPLDKAGSYAIQDQGETIVECIHGSYSNVVGLPVERLQGVLTHWLRPAPQK
jgi:septum formation protein